MSNNQHLVGEVVSNSRGETVRGQDISHRPAPTVDTCLLPSGYLKEEHISPNACPVPEAHYEVARMGADVASRIAASVSKAEKKGLAEVNIGDQNELALKMADRLNISSDEPGHIR